MVAYVAQEREHSLPPWLMSQAGMELWESFADRRRLEVDAVVHAAALSGLKYQRKHANDEIGTHVLRFANAT